MFNLFKDKDHGNAVPPKKISQVLDEQLTILTKSIKIKNSVFVMSLFLGLSFLLYRFVIMEQEQFIKASNHIAVIDLKGAISANNAQGAGWDIAMSIKQAFDNVNAKAILIRANSGGGSPVQASMINHQLVRLKNKRNDQALNPSDIDSSSDNNLNKPIIVVIEDTCASACYMATVEADKIIAHPSSLVGSIGVRIDTWQFSEALNQLGVQRLTLTSGENKAILDPFVNMSEEKLQKVNDEIIMPLYDIFVASVEAARGSKLNTQHPDIFSGMVFHGHKALKLGLVDEISTYPMVIQDLYTRTNVDGVVLYNKKKFSFSSLIQSSFDKAINTYLENSLTLR